MTRPINTNSLASTNPAFLRNPDALRSDIAHQRLRSGVQALLDDFRTRLIDPVDPVPVDWRAEAVARLAALLGEQAPGETR